MREHLHAHRSWKVALWSPRFLVPLCVRTDGIEQATIRTVLTLRSLADEWAKGTCYYNICGPTEITILNSAHRHIPGAVLSIGKPLPNTTCYILDDDENPVPVGSKGSMWVGGAGVSRGYINLPELTSKRYKLDKFVNDGSTMFNTGDIVRWREDGSLETFGRSDDQVKIKVCEAFHQCTASLTQTGLPNRAGWCYGCNRGKSFPVKERRMLTLSEIP